MRLLDPALAADSLGSLARGAKVGGACASAATLEANSVVRDSPPRAVGPEMRETKRSLAGVVHMLAGKGAMTDVIARPRPH